jgi:signal transduction histidine kinase
MDLHWLANKLPEDQELLLTKTKSMSRLIDMTIQSVQRISSELRPGLLDDLGLSAAIEWQADEFENRTGIKCNVEVDPEEIVLDRDRSTTIFRIFQESLTNIARHANATMVNVSLKEESYTVGLKVSDNGKGITKEKISDPTSFGLIGMRERVHSFGGYLSITGTPKKGTTVKVRIPLDKREKLDDKGIYSG